VTTLLDRWQFGVTITYHFLFVPLTIGLGLLVAWMQTLAYRREDADWDRLSRFFAKLFLINFALGVVTGIVQEFQFGMNWSNYSIFVGNIFGAPLAMEGLLAFFMESTFLGLWIFGRDRLSKRVHLACIWLVAFGSTVSALFILAANAWMQHPVGYKIVDHKALLTNIWAVFANSTLWEEFAHTVLAAFVTGAMVVAGVSAWQMLKHRDVAVFARSARLATAFATVCLLATITTGDLQARLMDEQQPMKMAAAEALYNTQAGASFSLLTIGNLSGQPIFQIRVPHLLSLIADMSYDGKVVGINQIQKAEATKYGPGSYVPVIWVTYWSFRLMVGLGFLMLALAAWSWWISRKRSRWRLAETRWTLWLLVGSIVAPFAANTFGWLFTEMGRQPWIVYGLMKTSQAISPTVGAATVIATLTGFTVLYTALGAVDIVLMSRSARASLPPVATTEHPGGSNVAEHGAGAEASLVY
jgi:cytochrome d ubiquinol oxidase subunit I